MDRSNSVVPTKHKTTQYACSLYNLKWVWYMHVCTRMMKTSLFLIFFFCLVNDEKSRIDWSHNLAYRALDVAQLLVFERDAQRSAALQCAGSSTASGFSYIWTFFIASFHAQCIFSPCAAQLPSTCRSPYLRCAAHRRKSHFARWHCILPSSSLLHTAGSLIFNYTITYTIDYRLRCE